MDGLGFITDQVTGMQQPSSMYNVSTVSINEAFSPLLGVDATFQNNLTAKLEYRTSRVLSLSMTSIQLNEALSRDWVVGMGYKIQDFNLYGAAGNRKVKRAQSASGKSGKVGYSGSSGKSGVNHEVWPETNMLDISLHLFTQLKKQRNLSRSQGTASYSHPFCSLVD